MIDFKVESRFDPVSCRQYLNDELTVFHCHHYTTLFSQLADDADLIKGAKHLKDAAAEAMLSPMKKYCDENNITSIEDKASIAEQYFSYVGLGKISINVEANSATMTNSHVDEGWVKKMGKGDKPVNFIGQGFIEAAFALVNGDTPDAYEVAETQSIVSGADTSEFGITKK